MTPQTHPHSAMSPAVAVHAAMHSVSAAVALARGMATSGRSVDLAGIDVEAGRLCAQVLDLPPLIGATFRPALMELHSSLGALAALLPGGAR